MTLNEDIKRLQSAGRSEQEIVAELQAKGNNIQSINDALNQTKIKGAVTSEPAESQESAQTSGMQPSLMNPQSAPEVQPEADQYQQQQQYTSYAPNPGAQQPQSYSPNYESSSASIETITDIADQIVAERLHSLKQDLDKVSDFRSTILAQLAYLDERLKKIEKTIDTLQVTILRKVGDSLTNINDLKNELHETQKSFKSISPQTRQKSLQSNNSPKR